MKLSDYQENRQRGTYEFPVEYHYVDASHPQYYMPLHWHMEYELLRVQAGALTLTLDERVFTAEKNDIVFIRSGIVHSGSPSDHCTYECVVFDLNMLYKQSPLFRRLLLPVSDGSTVIFDHFSGADLAITSITDRLFVSLASENTHTPLLAVGALYDFFGTVFAQQRYSNTNFQTTRTHHRIDQLKKVIAYIEEHYSSAITLDQLSKIAGMSPKYFCRYFQELTHQSPMTYINHHRVQIAAHLLQTTDLSITEVGFSCGFNDPSYFIKTFKRYMHTTPGRYARLREGI